MADVLWAGGNRMGGKPGRKWGPLRSEYGELRELAAVLRGVADGHGVTLRDLENRMPYGHTAISENLNGAKRPEWRFVVAFLGACAGGDKLARSELERKIRPLWEAAGQGLARRIAPVATTGDGLIPADVRTWVAQLHETVRTVQVVTELQSSVNRNVGLIHGLTYLMAQISTAVTTLSTERDALRKELAAREADARELHQTRQILEDTQRRLAAAERLQTEMSRRLDEARRQREEAENLKQEAIAQAEVARRRLADLEGDAIAFTSHATGPQDAARSSLADLMGPADQAMADEILRTVDTTLGDEAANLSALQAQVIGASEASPHTAELSAGQSLPGASASADNDRGDRTERSGTGTRRRRRPSGDSQTPKWPSHRIWHFPDSGPMTIVCAQLPSTPTGPLVHPADPNYSELVSFADLDALVELHGHIRAENPLMDIFVKAPPQVTPDDLAGHVVLIGGIIWNDISRRILDLVRLPVAKIQDPDVPAGEIFVTEIDGMVRKYLPRWSGTDQAMLIEDVGLLSRMPNPLNSNRTFTICNGIHSRGVLGAARSLTDARLRDPNMVYIEQTFQDDQQFGILMRIPVIAGKVMTPDFTAPGTVLYQWSIKLLLNSGYPIIQASKITPGHPAGFQPRDASWGAELELFARQSQRIHFRRQRRVGLRRAPPIPNNKTERIAAAVGDIQASA